MPLNRALAGAVMVAAGCGAVEGGMPDGVTADAPDVDELHLYFASDRAGGAGGYDIYEASRASTADGFGAPVNLGVLNTTGPEWPSWISADGCVLYLTRSINGYDLYVAVRGM